LNLQKKWVSFPGICIEALQTFAPLPENLFYEITDPEQGPFIALDFKRRFPKTTVLYAESIESLHDRLTDVVVTNGTLLSVKGETASVYERSANESVIVVFNFAKLTPGELAGTNEWFDDPAMLLGLPIYCRFVSLIDSHMLINAPGDHLNRQAVLQRFPNQNLPLSKIAQAFESDLYENQAVLEFHHRPDWRTLIGGVPSLNTEGQLIAAKDQFSTAADYASKNGKPLVIKNGPKDGELTFFLENFAIQNEGIRILYFNGYTASEIESIGNNVNYIRDPQMITGSVFTVNPSNMGTLFGSTRVLPSGTMVTTGGLVEEMKANSVLKTSPDLPFETWCTIFTTKTPSKLTLWIPNPESAPPALFQTPNFYIAHSKPVPPITLDIEGLRAIPKGACLIQTRDVYFASQVLESRFANALVMDMSKLTDEGDFTGSITVNSFSNRLATWQDSDFIQAIQNGSPIIIRGLTPFMASLLESFWGHTPYFMVNGQVMHFPKESFQLIALAEQVPDFFLQQRTPTYVLQLGISQYMDRLKHEFPNGFQAQYLETIMQHWPKFKDAVSPINNTSPAPELTYLWLKKIMNQIEKMGPSNSAETWLSAVDKVVLSEYKEKPEVHAYLSIFWAQVLNPSQERSFDKNRLYALAQKESQVWSELGIPCSTFWQAAACLSPALIRNHFKNSSFNNPDYRLVSTLKNIILNHIAVWEDLTWFEDLLNQKKPTPIEAMPVVRQMDEVAPEQVIWQAIQTEPIVLIKGSPGTGKSHILQHLSELINNSNLVVSEPLPMGPAITREDLLAKPVVKDDQVLFQKGPVTHWLEAAAVESKYGLPTQLLWADEYNLAPSQTLGLVKGLRNQKPSSYVQGKDHPLTHAGFVGTGNDDLVEGRTEDPVLREYALTVHLSPMNENRQLQILRKNFASVFSENELLLNAGLPFLMVLQRGMMALVPEHDYSIRDLSHALQVACSIDQVASIRDPDPLARALIKAYMSVFHGKLSDGTADAFCDWASSALPAPMNEIKSASPALESKTLDERYPDFDFQNPGVRFIQQGLGQFLKMAAYHRVNPQLAYHGKRMFHIEGEPGWGKDQLLGIMLAETARELRLPPP